MSKLASDRVCRHSIVAGQHDDADAVGLQRGERFGRAGLDRIGDPGNSCDASVKGDEDCGGSFVAKPVGRCGERAEVNASLLHDTLIADHDAASVDDAADALPRRRLEVLSVSKSEALFFRRLHNRGAERMLTASFHTRGQTQVHRPP